MREEQAVAQLIVMAQRNGNKDVMAVLLRDHVRRKLNEERAEVAALVLQEELDIDENPAKANPHEPRRWLEAAVRGAIARMVRERIEK